MDKKKFPPLEQWGPLSMSHYVKTDAVNKILLARYRSLIPPFYDVSEDVSLGIIQKAVLYDAIGEKKFYKQRKLMNWQFVISDQETPIQFAKSIERIEQTIHLICTAIVRFIIHNLMSTHFRQESQIRRQFQRKKQHLPMIAQFSWYQTFPTQIEVGKYDEPGQLGGLARCWYREKLFRTLLQLMESNIDDVSILKNFYDSYVNYERTPVTFHSASFVIQSKKTSHDHIVPVGYLTIVINKRPQTILAYADQWGSETETGVHLVCLDTPLLKSQAPTKEDILFKPIRALNYSAALGVGDYYIFGKQGKSHVLVYDNNDIKNLTTLQKQQDRQYQSPLQGQIQANGGQKQKGYFISSHKFIPQQKVERVSKKDVIKDYNCSSISDLIDVLFEHHRTWEDIEEMLQHMGSLHPLHLFVPLPRQATATTCSFHNIENSFRLFLIFREIVQTGVFSDVTVTSGSKQMNQVLSLLFSELLIESQAKDTQRQAQQQTKQQQIPS